MDARSQGRKACQDVKKVGEGRGEGKVHVCNTCTWEVKERPQAKRGEVPRHQRQACSRSGLRGRHSRNSHTCRQSIEGKGTRLRTCLATDLALIPYSLLFTQALSHFVPDHERKVSRVFQSRLSKVSCYADNRHVTHAAPVVNLHSSNHSGHKLLAF